jgi:hypothetical protein
LKVEKWEDVEHTLTLPVPTASLGQELSPDRTRLSNVLSGMDLLSMQLPDILALERSKVQKELQLVFHETALPIATMTTH